jgi:hypothetical protein
MSTISNLEVKSNDFHVQYEPESATVYFQGEISLGGAADYKPIVDLLNQSTSAEAKIITINVKELRFLNSSGISMLSKFVVGMKKKKNVQLVVLGSKKIPWQNKSLKNLERLLPGLKLVVE